MEKTTVIAKVRAELSLTEEFVGFLSRYSNDQRAWFARDGGDLFLAEFGREWNDNFLEVAQSIFDDYFRSLGLSPDLLPKVEMTDSRRGSWIMEAALTMWGTVGTTYVVLKGISELPKIADGLEDTKKRLQKELTTRFRKKVPERIEPVLDHSGLPTGLPAPVVAKPVSVSCSIDARPLRGLTPDVAKSHAIHLAVAVSRSALSVENLGDSALDNLRIGLFKSKTQRHNWSFADAFSRTVPALSGKQTLSMTIDQFVLNADGFKLDLSDPSPIFVDCWLQDQAGIYLFNFYLE